MSQVIERKGYSNVSRSRSQSDVISSLLVTAITRDGLENCQQSFLKRKRNGNLQIIKVVNNLLRNTVLVTYEISKLNSNKVIDVHYKRYRRNTVDAFGLPCREVKTIKYNLALLEDCTKFVKDVEKHVRVCPENLKTVNEALPLKLSGFDSISEDSLFAFEIYAFDIQNNSEDAFESVIDLSLVSDRMTKDITIKVKDIINFNSISDLIGKWVVLNYKNAFKIKTKDELKNSYNILN